MRGIIESVRYAFRIQRKTLGVTALAVGTLALGIGANTAIFSVANAVLLRPLPYHDPDQLVTLQEVEGADKVRPVAYANFADWRRLNRVFKSVAAWRNGNMVYRGFGPPEQVSARRVSAGFFATLGVIPAVGRTFLESEDRPGAERVAIVSREFWLSRLSGDVAVVGKTINLNGQPHTVIGVLPEFRFLGDAAVYTTLAPVAHSEARYEHNGTTVIARIKPGLTLAQVQANMDAITAQLEQQYPDANKNERARITLLRDRVSGGARKVVSILLGAVGLVLLIACMNVANLSLARAAERDREFAIRIAVGAGRGCIIRQLLTESVLLGIEAGMAGILLATLGVKALIAFVPAEAAAQGVSIDLTVLLFTLALSMLTGILFGLVPAITSSRPDLNVSLKEGRGGSSAGLGRNRLRSTLVVTEVALALVLLVGASLMIRSAWRLLSVDPGFQPERVLTCRIALNEQKVLREAGVDPKNLDVEKLVRYLDPWQRRLVENVRQVPGVRYAASAFPLDVTGDSASMPFVPEGQRAEGKLPEAYYHVISPDYFRAMGIPLRKGRSFTDRDGLDAPRVAVIGETLARQVWPSEDPIGKRFRFRYGSERVFTVVGVVADTKQLGLEGPTLPQMYMSWAQWPQAMNLIVRTHADPRSIAGEIRRAAADWDPDMPVYDLRTLEDRIAGMLAHRKRTTGLLIAFGALALLLAAVGVYSVLAYLVARRTREIGIRMALGAEKGALLGAVIGQGLAIAGLGLTAGLALSVALTRFLRNQLFGIEPLDPAALLISAAVLLASNLLASYVPARRAAKVDPIVALRHE